jgi:hypothetical protein
MCAAYLLCLLPVLLPILLPLPFPIPPAGAALQASVESSLRAVNLWNNRVADKQARAYSGGMKRRLSVAISFMGDPLVVYLDEPSTVCAVCTGGGEGGGARVADMQCVVVVWGGGGAYYIAQFASAGVAALGNMPNQHAQPQRAWFRIMPPLYTQGLDPASRRNLWDVVKANKAGRASPAPSCCLLLPPAFPPLLQPPCTCTCTCTLRWLHPPPSSVPH